MGAILYCWELGHNLGHVGAFLPLAHNLRQLGSKLHWAVAQPERVGSFLAKADFSWLPAPVAPEIQLSNPPLSYSDILLRFGYGEADALFGLVGAWREIMRLTGARLVLADHAPTAVLAARTLGMPVMLFSNGFTVPPNVSPFPNMRPWLDIPSQDLVCLDRAALDSVNNVLARFSFPPLERLADLFDVTENTLITYPELDHYPNRGPARYWGNLPSSGAGSMCDWPKGRGPRIFTYLRRESPHHEVALDALRRFGQPTVVYFPDGPEDIPRRFAAPHMLFLTQPANIAQMAKDASIGVTYASLATTTAFLLAGKPLLLMPGHLEQFLLARRVVDMGAGILVNSEMPPGDLTGTLSALCTDVKFTENAQAFAQKYAAFDQSRVIDNLTRRILEILGEERVPEMASGRSTGCGNQPSWCEK